MPAEIPNYIGKKQKGLVSLYTTPNIAVVKATIKQFNRDTGVAATPTAYLFTVAGLKARKLQLQGLLADIEQLIKDSEAL